MSQFAEQKRNHLEQVKAEAQRLTKERIERDLLRVSEGRRVLTADEVTVTKSPSSKAK